jgi:magnesium chelatase family protein
VKYRDLACKEMGEASSAIRDRVAQARALQANRFRSRRNLFSNADMQSRDIREFCRLDEAGEELLKLASQKLGFSARAYDRILKVARTIADLAAASEIRPEHISEAIQYRSLDRNLF